MGVLDGEETGQIRIFQPSEMDCAKGIVNQYLKGSPGVSFLNVAYAQNGAENVCTPLPTQTLTHVYAHFGDKIGIGDTDGEVVN